MTTFGIAEHDAENERLIALTRALVEAPDSTRADLLLDLLALLGSYITKHVTTEETMMLLSGYPDYEAHVREHRAFEATFHELVAAFARYGDEARVVNAVEAAVTHWIEHHVGATDAALGDWLRIAPAA